MTAPVSSRRTPLHRRLGAVLATLVMLVGGTVTPAPASAAPGKDRSPFVHVPPGHRSHIPILLYRDRHPDVTTGSNVASVEYRNAVGNKSLIIVGDSRSKLNNSAPWVAKIDLFLYDPVSGTYQLVDMNLKPMANNGKASYEYNLGESDVAKDDLDDGQAHSERNLDNFTKEFEEHFNELAEKNPDIHVENLSTRESELITERAPCTYDPSQCDKALRQREIVKGWQKVMYVTDAPSATQATKLRKEARQKGRPEDEVAKIKSADVVLSGFQRQWGKLGKPIGADTVLKMNPGQLFNALGNRPTSGAVASALDGADPGGIDFSTLQLRYLSEGSGGQLQYAFDASTGTGGKTGDGQVAAAQSSDAFFVWLSLPPSTFWVNLNPSEPDRIVDAKLGTTDVGRILLQADFRMKKVVGQLIHPDTAIGKQFWGAGSPTGQSCIDMRQWIVPKPATVYEQGSGLYIVDAPLEVRMETDYLKQQGVQGSCTTPDAQMESTFRTLVLPKVEAAVNHSADFAELRRVYLSRVAAEWYRQKHSHGGLLSSMIDSNEVSAWPALQNWSPRQVFDQYVDSYNKKEFNVTKRYTEGNTIYVETYTYGGVDFSNVVLHGLSPAAFQQQHPGVTNAVQRSYQQPTQAGPSTVLLGGTSHPVLPGNLNDPATMVSVATSRTSFWYVVTGPLVLWLLAGALLVVRRRRRSGPGPA
jgi:hypothetical protein